MVSINPSMAGEVKRIEIFQVFKRLESSNVLDLKFILREKIVESVAEKIKTPLELLDCLDKLGVLGFPNSLECLAQLMITIGRRDLASQLTGKSYAVDLTHVTISSYAKPNENGIRIYSDFQTSPPSVDHRAKQDAIYKENKSRGMFFDKASELIGPFWTRFARCSGLDQHTVDIIDRNERTVQERALKLLDMMWQAGHLNWPIMEDMLRGLQRYQIIRTLDDLRKELEKANDEMKFFKIAIDNKAHQTTVGGSSSRNLGFALNMICERIKNLKGFAQVLGVGYLIEPTNYTGYDKRNMVDECIREKDRFSEEKLDWFYWRSRLLRLEEYELIAYIEESFPALLQDKRIDISCVDIIEKKKAIGKFLDRVSVLIGPFWHQFGRYSGIEPAVVETIEQDEIGVRSKADRLLQKMQDKQLDWSIIEHILLRQKQYEVIRQLRAERDLIPTKLIQDIDFFKTSAKLEVNLNEYEAVSIFLDKVATKIGGFWERFSNYAGCDIGIIKADGGGAQKQAYKLLSKMRAESSPLKWITIKDILSDMGRNDVIRFLEIEIGKLEGIYGKHPFFNTDSDTTTAPIQDSHSNNDSSTITTAPIQDSNSNNGNDAITTTPIQDSNFNNDIDTITTTPIQDSIYSIDFNNEEINYVINKETVPDIVKECNSETPSGES